MKVRSKRRALIETKTQSKKPEPKPEPQPKAKVDSDTVTIGKDEETKKKEAAQKLIDAQPPKPIVPEITPERKMALDVAVEQQKLPADVLQNNPTIGNKQLVDTLKGNSPAGQLNEAEKRYVMNGALDSMIDSKTEPGRRRTNYAAIHAIRDEAMKDPELAPVVSEALAERSTKMLQEFKDGKPAFPDERALASSLAAESMLAAGSTKERAALLTKLGTEKTVMLSNALVAKPDDPADGGVGLWGGSSNYDMKNYSGGLLLTAAAANKLYGDDPAKLESESKRIDAILNTSQGQQMLTNHELTLEQKYVHAGLLLAHPEWDENFMKKTSSAFDNPEIAQALAMPAVKAYADQRGDNPEVLSGPNLENTIGFSMGFQPVVRENEPEGTYSYYSTGPGAEVVKPIADSIREVGGADPKVTVLPIQYASRDTGAVQLKLFRVQDKTTGEDRFVDNQGRVYQSFEDWKANNKLPPGSMTHPPGGHMTKDAKLETAATPKTVDTPTEYVVQALDYAALAGGTIAGGAMIIGSGGVLAPVVAGAAAAYGAYRNISELDDRYQHGQTINPLQSSEARAEWLGLGANVLGFASVGGIGLANKALQTGSKLAPALTTGASALTAGANVMDSAAAIENARTLVANWDQMNGQDRATLALSLGFWGANTLGRTKLSGAKITDMYSYRAIKDGLVNAQPNAVNDGYTPPKKFEEMTSAERQADFVARNPNASSASKLSPEQFQKIFGDGPWDPTAVKLASTDGFETFAKTRPEDARAIYDAGTILDQSFLFGNPPNLEQAALRAKQVIPKVEMRKVPTQSGELIDYRVATAPGTPIDNIPALRLSPTSPQDHNGAFMRNGLVRNDMGLETWMPTKQTRETVFFRRDQLVTDPKTGAVVDNMREVAVFGGHGSKYGISGMSTEQNAQLMAKEIINYRKKFRNATELKYVVLEACNQGDKRGGYFFGETNAQDFQRILNRELINAGQKPVNVLAAERAGVLYGGAKYDSIFPWRSKIDARFVSPSEQLGGVPNEVKRYLSIGGAAVPVFAGAGAGGAFIVQKKIREMKQTRRWQLSK